jgi:hypothetical protein
MPLIRETMLTTISREGRVHIAPMGIIAEGDGWIVAPFHPSATLDNLRTVPFAVANYTDDVRIFAGCLTGRAHAPFEGFNRAKAAVIEAAILVSRLHMLPREKIEAEVAYLEIAVAKTAGTHEAEAWSWLMDAIRAHYAGGEASPASRR